MFIYSLIIKPAKGKRICQCACHNEFDYHKVVFKMHIVESKSGYNILDDKEYLAVGN